MHEVLPAKLLQGHLLQQQSGSFSRTDRGQLAKWPCTPVSCARQRQAPWAQRPHESVTCGRSRRPQHGLQDPRGGARRVRRCKSCEPAVLAPRPRPNPIQAWPWSGTIVPPWDGGRGKRRPAAGSAVYSTAWFWPSDFRHLLGAPTGLWGARGLPVLP